MNKKTQVLLIENGQLLERVEILQARIQALENIILDGCAHSLVHTFNEQGSAGSYCKHCLKQVTNDC